MATLEEGNAGFDFDDGVADGFEAEAAVGLGEDFAFDDASVVADRNELHLVAGDLMLRAIAMMKPQSLLGKRGRELMGQQVSQAISGN